MQQSRRDVFEEQLRDLQNDISCLSDKLSTTRVPLETSLGEASYRDGPGLFMLSLFAFLLTLSSSLRLSPPLSSHSRPDSSSPHGLKMNGGVGSSGAKGFASTSSSSSSFSYSGRSSSDGQTAVEEIHQARKERDDAVFELTRAKKEVAELRSSQQEYVQLRSAFEHLKNVRPAD